MAELAFFAVILLTVLGLVGICCFSFLSALKIRAKLIENLLSLTKEVLNNPNLSEEEKEEILRGVACSLENAKEKDAKKPQ